MPTSRNWTNNKASTILYLIKNLPCCKKSTIEKSAILVKLAGLILTKI